MLGTSVLSTVAVLGQRSSSHMDLFIQRLFDGLFNGAIYASLALALVTIYRSTGLLNFAQAELATFSAYVGLVLAGGSMGASFGGLAGTGLLDGLPGYPFSVPVAVLLATIFGMVAGALLEVVIFRGLERGSPLALVNVTIGLLIVLSGLTTQFWGGAARIFPQLFPADFDDFVWIGGARLRYTTIGSWATLLVVLVVITLLMNRTKAGLAFRAITSNRESARLMGIPVGRTLMLGWAVAGGLGALAACLTASVVSFSPFTMLGALIYALAAATLGGLDSPKGAIVGGIIVAQAQTMIPGYLGLPTELAVVAAVIVLVVVLLFKPSGLFGTVRVERV